MGIGMHSLTAMLLIGSMACFDSARASRLRRLDVWNNQPGAQFARQSGLTDNYAGQRVNSRDPDAQDAAEFGGTDAATALQQLKEAASEIKRRFRDAQQHRHFGLGIRSKLLRKMTKDSEDFWDFVEHIDEMENINDWTEEDARDLQTLIAQVAQMDDDLDDPRRVRMAEREYSVVVQELRQAGARV